MVPQAVRLPFQATFPRRLCNVSTPLQVKLMPAIVVSAAGGRTNPVAIESHAPRRGHAQIVLVDALVSAMRLR
jgi:hypothetical protein